MFVNANENYNEVVYSDEIFVALINACSSTQTYTPKKKKFPLTFNFFPSPSNFLMLNICIQQQT